MHELEKLGKAAIRLYLHRNTDSPLNDGESDARANLTSRRHKYCSLAAIALALSLDAERSYMRTAAFCPPWIQ